MDGSLTNLAARSMSCIYASFNRAQSSVISMNCHAAYCYHPRLGTASERNRSEVRRRLEIKGRMEEFLRMRGELTPGRLQSFKPVLIRGRKNNMAGRPPGGPENYRSY
jgi:hypothetical protein